MYLSVNAIKFCLEDLEGIHPFFGITYLVCKRSNLPVGKDEEFSINSEETVFLEKYYKPVKNSEKFFRVFRPSDKDRFWLNSDYASSGSQATRTQMFGDAFIHQRNSNRWGWKEDYIQALEEHLKKRKIPAYSLAIWIYKDVKWDKNETIDDITASFFKEFNISDEEIKRLFILERPNLERTLLSNDPYDWNVIAEDLNVPLPSDVPVEKGGALVQLELKGMETTQDIVIDLSDRLNIITGDNGLGKSFILECAWWALTQSWTGFPIYPRASLNGKPQISFKISNSQGRIQSFRSNYDWKLQKWVFNNKDKKTIPGLAIYARVDGAFAIWDPARIYLNDATYNANAPLIFSRENVWDGLRVDDKSRSRSIFNGLITDWVHWQNSQNEAFEILIKVLKRLSPPDLTHGDLGSLSPGNIVRIPGESRPIPTIKHPYGEVPIVFASAAVKRIVALAYLIVWTWEEHKTAATLMHEDPQTKMVVIADEIEAHLHPQWQRVILPAITSISDDLSEKLDIQFIITTHSPLVMASVEPIFNEKIDKIFHLNLQFEGDDGIEVRLDNPKFEKRGSADSWLISDIFDLKQPRSLEAEQAIEEAKALQLTKSPSQELIQNTNEKLLNLLAPHDTFWIRWNFFAENHGVKI